MNKYLLFSLVILGLCGTADLQAIPLRLPVVASKAGKAYPNRLRRTMRRLHRQAQSRARKNRSNG